MNSGMKNEKVSPWDRAATQMQQLTFRRGKKVERVLNFEVTIALPTEKNKIIFGNP